jgi:hypothetical protein
MFLHFLNTGPSAGPLLMGLRNRSAALAPVPATARGDIDFDQILVAARTGNGNQLHTWTTPAPGGHGSTGTPGQIAYDSSGNLYVCYAANSWAKFTGSTSF